MFSITFKIVHLCSSINQYADANCIDSLSIEDYKTHLQKVGFISSFTMKSFWVEL